MLNKLTLILLLLSSTILFAQRDSIKLTNGDVLIGRIKGLDRSVLTYKTQYSDSDFKVKWGRVREVYSGKREFVLQLSDGKRFHSSINTDSTNTKKVVLFDQGVEVIADLNKVIYLDPFTEKFFKRIEAAFDVGINLTKANNYSQITSNAKLSYVASKSKFSFGFGLVYSQQDSTENIQRYDADLSMQRYFNNDWFLPVTTSILSNSDQKLKLRSTTSVGAGYFFKKNNSLAFSAKSGLAFNNETYTDDDVEGKNSMEYFIGSEFSKYNIGDFGLESYAILSPSITENKRIRFDFNFDLKYDITSNLFIKASLTYNYDNQPVEGATEGDYIFQTTFGWDND